MINFEEAKKIATSQAIRAMGPFWPSDGTPVLSDEYIEAPNFWFFFRNEKVELPPEAWVQRTTGYVVSNRGLTCTVADFRPYPDKLKEVIEELTRRLRPDRVSCKFIRALA